MRYWDGAAWAERDQVPATSAPPALPTANVSAPVKREGAFARLRSARELRTLSQTEAAEAAGAMVTSGVFGTSTVEIFEGGYVRVASGERTGRMGRSQPGRAMSPGATVPMKKSVPYERLRSIKFTPSTHDQKASSASPLEGAVGPALAKVMKGGRSALKGSLPGLAASGIAHVASTDARTSYLTIATDKEVHQLTNQGHNGYIRTTNRAHVDVGLALAAAGTAVIPSTDTAAQPSPIDSPSRQAGSQPVDLSSAVGGSTLAERIRELSALHDDGILTGEEFAAAKARLLAGL